MDDVTRAIRDMYEQYPYPAGQPVNRVGGDVDLVLSYGSRAPGQGRRQVLDAGCGRGLGLLGAATLQPDVSFTGADINRVALRDAAGAAAARGLKNVDFVECDLMTLEGLAVPDGGYDVIHSSGVLHHLSDPAAGLRRLADALAPHGVINLMVYGREGRRPLLKAAEAAALTFAEGAPLAERIAPARQVAALGRDHLFGGSRFADTAGVDDVELVDRLLNVNETTYDIPGLWALLEAAGLRFLRWIEPADWDVNARVADADLRRRLLARPEEDRFRFLEIVFRPPGLELVVARADNAPRPPLRHEDVERTVFRLNPELVVGTNVRRTAQGSRVESLTWKLRTRDPRPLPAGPAAAGLMAVKDLDGALPGRRLLRALTGAGLSDADARAVAVEFVRAEILYRPHA